MVALIQSDTSVMLQHACNMYDEDIAFGEDNVFPRA